MTSEVRFQPARPRRAFDEIIAQIRAMIHSGELSTGDRLPSERALAEQFDVSRNTVREAVRMLEISGLVTIKKGATGGAFIARPDAASIAQRLSDAMTLTEFSLSDLTEARLWIEALVVRVACERMSDEDLEALQANVDESVRLSEDGLWEECPDALMAFHELLARATDNPILSILMQSILDLIRQVVAAVGPLRDLGLIEARFRLMDRLHARDPDGAVAEMESHLRRLHQLWLTGAESGDPHPPRN
ncbi:FadR family transcriptional regulator [Saccharopolyspora sp. HNM0983]|uniref:FadR family transcriptional regulator n=1 Tax=Saccharopolyspora montiporae TaxID=2781240 RepID=A0A929B7J7_9PSEU|nr:FadR/GntR family transcriptional regulator [Saccharopolyspora sp. HNM0983]MBE9372866.1 FadR family transcriptional regulator [Saccharopolyspora sp. HNM0983]